MQNRSLISLLGAAAILGGSPAGLSNVLEATSTPIDEPKNQKFKLPKTKGTVSNYCHCGQRISANRKTCLAHKPVSVFKG
jgi:anaerobic selenocysteine-containing dehydrogenase